MYVPNYVRLPMCEREGGREVGSMEKGGTGGWVGLGGGVVLLPMVNAQAH
jgi:hypothetical protein